MAVAGHQVFAADTYHNKIRLYVADTDNHTTRTLEAANGHVGTL